MEVALVNTNRYLDPPVIPVGLEYLVAPLQRGGHRVEICDLAFSDDPTEDLMSFLEDSAPGIICFSVRNVDTALYGDNQFFLDEISSLIRTAGEHTGLPTVAGGSSSLCSVESLRACLGADCLVAGPGEKALPALVDLASGGGPLPEVADGWAAGIIPDISHPRGREIDYSRYLEGGNPAGLEFRKGCSGECRFCVERKRPVLKREIPAVLREARRLAEAGAGMVFLCDSEVNLDREETNLFLGTLAGEGLGLELSGYFQPVPFDEEMARLARASGFGSLTLSVSSWDLPPGEGRYGAADIERFCGLCADNGIKVAVDLLIGYPGEDTGSVEAALDLLSGVKATTVGVNQYIRLYESTPAFDDAMAGGVGELLGEGRYGSHPMKPVFYCQVDREWLRQKIAGDDRFVLEGVEKTVNYQRV